MKHYLDVRKLKGSELPFVDVVTFGSPCQSLSVAGKREGIRHETLGDEETTRSGLFMDAIRIITEMREASNGIYPTFAVWENVYGAFSSSGGEDFRIVLEELIKIVEPTAKMPAPDKKGWAYADIIVGDGWSIAYRLVDAQYWGKSIRDRDSGTVRHLGTPQRRRRIYLVADFRGERAGEILFKREGLRGHFTQGRTPWQGITADAERCIGTDDSARSIIAVATQQGGAELTTNGICPTVTAAAGMSGNNQPWICTYDARGNGDGETVSTITGDHNNRVTDYTSLVCEGHRATYWDGSQVCGTLTANNAGGTQRMPDKDNFNCVLEPVAYAIGNGVDRPAVVYAVDQGGEKSSCNVTKNLSPTLTCTHGGEPAVALDRAFYNQGQNALYDPQFYTDGTVPTLVAKGPGAVCTRYIVHRLTPTECARLQGFPDKWGHLSQITDMSEEDVTFWNECLNVNAEIKGKTYKNKTKEQLIKWYNKLHTDSAEYKMWGNGIALPNALYLLEGIAEHGAKTMGSLFDGSGGFPLASSMCGIEPIWASEIEPYPIAVTKERFD